MLRKGSPSSYLCSAKFSMASQVASSKRVWQSGSEATALPNGNVNRFEEPYQLTSWAVEGPVEVQIHAVASPSVPDVAYDG
ncbi:hypothetical protein PG999_003315 [Apiospora kogelbergensis]|uniref:Uncharacterized protein n=1 Tax=Apiospora kogelbergensis TaxID=1337665 RepID=A0AAW0R375_9PEZI